MSKMALSTLINECKKYVWTNVYKLSKQSIKKTRKYITGFKYNATKSAGKSLFK